MAMDNSPFISFMDTSFPLCHIWLPDRPWWPWCPRSWSKALISLATEVLFALAVLNLVGTPRGVQRSSCWRDEWHVWGYYISTFKTWEWWSLLDMFWVFVEVLTTCSYIFSLRHLETPIQTPRVSASFEAATSRRSTRIGEAFRCAAGPDLLGTAPRWPAAAVTSSNGWWKSNGKVSLFGDEKSPKKWKRNVNTKHQNQHFEGPFSPLVLHFWTLATLIFEKMGYGMVVGYQLMDRWFRLKRPKIAVAHNKAFICWDTWFWYILIAEKCKFGFWIPVQFGVWEQQYTHQQQADEIWQSIRHSGKQILLAKISP